VVNLLAAGALLLLAPVPTRAAESPPPETVLANFSSDPDLRHVRATDAAFRPVTIDGAAWLRVDARHQDQWPGVTLAAPQEHWDLSAHDDVALDIRNLTAEPLKVFGRVDNPGADGTDHCVYGTVEVQPGKTDTLRVRLTRGADDRLGGQLFGLRGYPLATGGRGTIDAARITQLIVFLSQPTTNHSFAIGRPRAGGRYVRPTAWVTDADPFLPFIDPFGQYRHRDWPGKVHSLEELRQRIDEETADWRQHPGPRDWNRYGGWNTGPKLAATGFFRTQKHQGRWWLVDPEGRLFFSHGIDCVRMLDVTPIDQRAAWFVDFPGNDPAFAEFLHPGFALKGHYANTHPRCFSFAGANLKRKYGPEWPKEIAERVHLRLRNWGLNTIGMWSDETIRLQRRTVYVDAIGSHGCQLIEGSEGYWGKFPDVFDSSFAETLRRSMAAKKDKSAGDPWCLGYFADNELSWGDEHALGIGTLTSPSTQAAKRVFVNDLKTAYGDIARLNAAWGTTHASWDALLESRVAPDPQRARDDLNRFQTRAADQYFRGVRDAIKEVAPNQLYLGCRFAWVNPRAAASAAKFCDVVSYNIYRRQAGDLQYPGGADVPVIIGEFHFGALDRGLFHTGLVPVASQADRAQAYLDYVRGVLRHPLFVGCHWFQYQDEPTTGRVYDEENYQIGFVDIADTPYPETIAASRQIGAEMYRLRLQQ